VMLTPPRNFVTTLQRKMSSLQALPRINPHSLPVSIAAALLAIIRDSLTRNQQLNRVSLLMDARSPPRQQQNQEQQQQQKQQQQQEQQQRHVGTIMLRSRYKKAVAKFAIVPDNAGSRAMFKLFTARPQLLEKRIQLSAAAMSASASVCGDEVRTTRKGDIVPQCRG
jgi:hypothetical protein